MVPDEEYKNIGYKRTPKKSNTQV